MLGPSLELRKKGVLNGLFILALIKNMFQCEFKAKIILFTSLYVKLCHLFDLMFVYIFFFKYAFPTLYFGLSTAQCEWRKYKKNIKKLL